MNLKVIFRRWFGYSRRERTGSLLLVVIISIVVVISLFNTDWYDESALSIRSEESAQMKLSDSIVSESESSLSSTSYFEFDPNTISYSELLDLGFTVSQANTLINYRNTGARFYGAEDIRRVYGLSRAFQDSLVRYIVIKSHYIHSDSSIITNITDKSKVEPASDISSYPVAEVPVIMVDINLADSIQLQLLPGIGKVLGPRIVKYRNLLGGFVSIDQLSEVYGIDSLLVDSIRDYILVDRSAIRKIDIDRVSFRDLLRHPYFGRRLTDEIISFREFNGSIRSLEELVINGILEKYEVERLQPYIIISDTTQAVK